MGKAFFKNIIVAINGRQNSIRAAMYGIMMARTYKLGLKFVYVVDTATIKYLSMNKFLITEEKDDFESKLRNGGEHYLNYVISLAVSKGVKAEKELRTGGVYTEILKCVEEFSADLVLVGGIDESVTRKHLGRNVISSNENELLLNSTVPVLVVKKTSPKSKTPIEDEFKVF